MSTPTADSARQADETLALRSAPGQIARTYVHETTVEVTPSAARLPFLAGRLIFGGYFLYNGVNHFQNHEMMSGYAKSKGVPAPEAAVAATGAMLVAGGLSLITGVRPKLGAALISTFLAGVSPKMHAFWAEADPQQQMAEMVNFTKNMALIGGALLAASVPEPWPLSLGSRNGDDLDGFLQNG